MAISKWKTTNRQCLGCLYYNEEGECDPPDGECVMDLQQEEGE